MNTALDTAAVEAWMTAQVPGFRGPIQAEKFATGQSNPTFKLSAPSGAYVLRRKPLGQLLKSAHAVDREFRVQRALAGTDVPVTWMRALCEDDSVIGSMFYVMDYVAGRTFVDPRMPDLGPNDRAAIFDDMNRALAAIHSVDLAATGLADYGPKGNYYQRQIDRWSKQYRASETEAIPDMDALINWLQANLPEDDGRVTLVHGDYRIDNLLFAPDSPKCVAVLDWELSTLGHPYADLAAVIMQWSLPPETRGAGWQVWIANPWDFPKTRPLSTLIARAWVCRASTALVSTLRSAFSAWRRSCKGSNAARWMATHRTRKRHWNWARLSRRLPQADCPHPKQRKRDGIL